MKVSVIIPAYNVEQYIEQSVQSALEQPETDEVLVIDDGSKDNTLAVCHKLQQTHPNKVKVLTHPDGGNHGSAVARNIGLKAATNNFIAFIDGDDFFLADRFALTKQLFEQHPEIDGVYEATVNYFEEHAQSYSKTHLLENVADLHMLDHEVKPNELLQTLLEGKHGVFLLQGLCIKAGLLKKSGYFDAAFREGQDMLLIKKMAAVGRLIPGDLKKPIATRRIHTTNITFSQFKDVSPTRFKEGETLLKWGIKEKLPNHVLNLFMLHYFRQYTYKHNTDFNNAALRRQFMRKVLMEYPLKAPQLKSFWKLVPLIGRFLNS